MCNLKKIFMNAIPHLLSMQMLSDIHALAAHIKQIHNKTFHNPSTVLSFVITLFANSIFWECGGV